ncbi:MAG: D-alanine--D-alanine ligase [Bacteroidetes bacterium]|nr:D-alanine--D-alanine ligase [Bacteroidota bacterium]
MGKLKVAIITGGNVAERGISLESAKTIKKHLSPAKYESYIIDLKGIDFIEQSSGNRLDKNDFSLFVNNEKIKFDLVFLILHGHPAEDGCLQGYFEILGIPYTGSDHFVCALTFNKQACKEYLRNYNIPLASSELVRNGMPIKWQALEKLTLPLFVKPNKNGSSYGVTKVFEKDQLEEAIKKSLQFDDEVIVEEFLEGKEYSNGVVRKNGEIIVLPVTEIISQNEFFDYKAKYENQSQEVTPAALEYELRDKCKAQSQKLYELLDCKGMTRFDYILVGDSFYFLEANTIPGMAEQSIIPQQALAHGWTITELLDAIIEEAIGKSAIY